MVNGHGRSEQRTFQFGIVDEPLPHSRPRPTITERYLRVLASVVRERRWILHAWVLMRNHYHLLVETPEVGLSRGIKSLNQEYAEGFNRRHTRVGHLFQGRFKGILVEREGHLLELLRYIVLIRSAVTL